MQVNLTGGEPLVRDDLEELVAAARAQRPLHQPDHQRHPARRARASRRLAAAGLDSVQLSVQDVDPRRRRPGSRARRPSTPKLEVAAWARALGLPLTLNVVLHRDNLGRVAEFVALAERLGADAPRARQHAVPRLGARQPRRAAAVARRSSTTARQVAAEARERACVARWRSCSCAPTTTPIARAPAWTAGRAATSSSRPDGRRAARATRPRTHPGADVRERPRPLARRRSGPTSPGFRAFRGEAWMPEPCRSCDERDRRLRRLPLPGLRAARRRRRDRSGLRAHPAPRPGARRARARRAEWRRCCSVSATIAALLRALKVRLLPDSRGYETPDSHTLVNKRRLRSRSRAVGGPDPKS